MYSTSRSAPWNAVARDYVERTRAAFTINLGIHVDGVDELIGWPVKHGLPIENECHVELRIGSLLDDGLDRWWEMSSENDVPAGAESVSETLLGVVLPCFGTYSSVIAVREWFDDPREPRLSFPRFWVPSTPCWIEVWSAGADDPDEERGSADGLVPRVAGKTLCRRLRPKHRPNWTARSGTSGPSGPACRARPQGAPEG